MKKLKIILLLLLSSLQLTYAQSSGTHLERSQQLAYHTAMKLIGTNDTYRYYVSQNTVRKDGENCWLVFVDKEPKAGWEHPCTYVYAKDGSRIIGDFTVVDSVCPPSDIRLIPVHKNNNVPEDTVKVRVAKGPENAFAANTYAVILSGGKNKNSNNARYWNDCSFIYQTLTKKYRVPKGNVKVLMSDGTDPAVDMCREVGDPYISSPLDLDDDGNPEIEYSATKANLRRVFSELSNELGDEDHLFVYVIDHGGYDYQKKSSYICLWNDEKLYPEELNSYLDGCEAGYISFVMGQCYSGGFSRELQANNRIIMTACGEDEVSYCSEKVPFDEYVYHWTCGLNGYDAYGNLLSGMYYKSEGVPYYKTLKAAHAYACKMDMYTTDDAVVNETPCISIFENSTADDLAFDYVPDVCELYITSGEEPTTPKNVFNYYDRYKDTQTSLLVHPQIYRKFRPVYWNSSDIWLRHQDDGLVNHTHQDGCLGPDEESIHVYAKIRNRGVKTYDSGSKMVRMWWARSAMKIDKKTWAGLKTNIGKGEYGNNIGGMHLYDTLSPGDSTIVHMEYVFKNDYLACARKDDFNVCLLAFIVDDSEIEDDFGETIDDSTLIVKVWETRRLAQKNLTDQGKDKVPSTVIPYYKGLEACELRVSADPEDTDVFKDMNVFINVSKGSVSEWTPQKKGDISPKTFRPSTMANRVQLSDSLIVRDVRLTGKNLCALTLSSEEIADMDIHADRDYTVNVELYDPKLQKTLGGQSFVVRRKARKMIDFDVSTRYDGMGNYELRAVRASEDVTCTWKDKDGNVVATGMECLVPANMVSGEYTVEARSTSDGAVNYKDFSLQRISKIDNVRANPDSGISVTFTTPAGWNTSLRLSSATTGQSAKDYPVDEGAMSVVIPTTRLQGEISTISLVENGKTTENVKFAK